MKKIALTTTVVLLSLVNLAQADDTTSSTPPAECCNKCSEKPCEKSTPAADSKPQEWLNIETVTLEAANGDPIAQYTVAYLTETGNEKTAPDSEKAKEWYTKSLPGLEKAAEEGHPAACRALAHMYAEGKGVEKNPEKAEKYMKMYKELCKKHCEKAKEKAPCNTDCTTPAPEPKN